MANVFTSTATITNLTRLELEQLRRADAFTAGKALTVGDAAYGSEGVVGKGDLNAEPYYTGPELPLDDIITNTPPTNPGKGLSTQTVVAGMPSDSVSWVGPELIYDSNVGWAETTTRLRDDTPGLNFTLFVQAGDLLLIKTRATGVHTRNSWAVGTVSVVAANTLTLTNINNPSLAPYNALEAESSTATYNYVVVRPSAAQLFAVPGSGPTGQEQTFMMVNPGASVHGLLSPTVDQVNAVRLKNVVPPHFSASTAVDRADAVYGSPAPRASLDMLGYRIVLYPDNGSGTGPDLTHPIATLNPVINSTIAASDQRMTIDYQAGIVRLSCAPRTGDDIKPAAGCVNATTGRLNLYAVYWVVDTSLTKGNARGLYASRNDYHSTQAPGKVEFDQTNNWWKFHSGVEGNYFYVRSLDTAETGETFNVTEFGAYDYANGPRGFKYRQSRDAWYFTRHTPIGSDPATSVELGLPDKTMLTMGDGANPPANPGGDGVPSTSHVSDGYRDVTDPLEALLKEASYGNYSVVHLRRGKYFVERTLHIPPGVELEGEGPTTVLRNHTRNNPLVRFGPNTPWGVYDFSWDGYNVTPAVITAPSAMTKVEGFDICWNANKRCWAFVWGDTTTHEIWFQEMALDGTLLHTNPGIPLKNSAAHLFTSESPAASSVARHTSGHAPRIAYDPYYNQYGVVWVVEGVLSGPNVTVSLFKVTGTDTASVDYTHTFGSLTTIHNHPSITYNTYAAESFAYVTTAVYASGSPPAVALHMVHSLGPTTYTYNLPTHYVITSTDVAVNTEGQAVVVWSCLNHLLIEGTSGSITAGAPSLLYHNSGIDFTTTGIEVGDKFHHLNLTLGSDDDGGLDGYICGAPAAGYVAIKHIDSPDKPWTAHAATNIRWAISPKSFIMSARLYSGTLTPSMVVDSAALSLQYFKAEMREPDFVRISAGADGRFLVVFQAFNSTAYLSKTSMTNFDGGVSMDFTDYGEIPVQSPFLYREHVGTCSVLLSADGACIEPLANTNNTRLQPTSSSGSVYQLTSITHVPAKSLGASDPLMPRPNTPWLNFQTTMLCQEPWGPKRGYHLDVSARNIVHKWTATKPTSLIPDVTWTGYDWTVVSPTQNKIFSDTGYIILDGGDCYLVDETYFFGTGEKTVTDGNYLPQTASGSVYFPDLDVSASYTVYSEHCVILDTTLPAGKVSYYATFADSTNIDKLRLNTGLKNMLFRVAADGSLIQGCSHLTTAMSHIGLNFEVYDPPYIPDTRIETVNRRKIYTQYSPAVSSGGGNDPMTWGYLAPIGMTDNSGQFNNYPTTRISGDIGFVGAAAGAPRGYGYNTPSEAPLVALAWGENFFALADRITATVNQIGLYRQSAGPYGSSVKKLRLENRTRQSFDLTVVPFMPLMMRMPTHTRVLTRWGLPAMGSAGFATDGYRNCFVYPTQKMGPMSSPSADPLDTLYYGSIYVGHALRHAISWNATYTNAVGEGPIEYTGPDSVWSNPKAFPPGAAVAPDTGTDPYPAMRRQYNNGAPVVIWNGTNFVAFWTEQVSQTVNGLQGNLICMGTYPGGEETNRLDCSITTLNDAWKPTVNEVVRVSCGMGLDDNGSGNTTNPNRGQLAVCDAAFSGNVYCVVWAVGLHPDSDTGIYAAGSTLGVTLFNGITQGGGATSFLIESVGAGLFLATPKIVWDGQAFVVFWRYGNDTTGSLHYQVVPEAGLGQNIQIRDIAAPTTQQYDHKHTIGTFYSDGTIWLSNAGDISCNPGDTLHIQSTRTAYTVPGTGNSSGFVLTDATADFVSAGVVAGDILHFSAGRYTITAVLSATQLLVEYTIGTLTGKPYTVYHYVYDTTAAGWYTVMDYNPVNKVIHLAIGTNGQWSGQEVIGAIFSAGIGNQTNCSIYDNANSQMVPRSAPFATGMTIPTASVNEYASLTGEPAAILSVIFNEQDNVFVIFYADENKNAAVMTVSRADFRPMYRSIIDTGNETRFGKISWNGQHYLAVYAVDNHYIQFALLSRSLTSEESGTLFYRNGTSPRHMCGTRYGQLPGPLYYSYVTPGSQTWVDTAPANGCFQPRPWNMDLKWNDRLGQWVLSVGYLWGLNNAASAYGSNDIQQEHGLRELVYYNGATYDNPVTSYSGRTLTGKFYRAMVQPGMRIAFWDTVNTHFAVIMTVMGVGPSTTDPAGTGDYYTQIYVDVDTTQLTADDRAVVTHTHSLGEPYSTYILAREDIYVTTLSTGPAAIEAHDADSCSLVDLEISGGTVDVSETFDFMARPTWRSAGAMTGSPSDVGNLWGASLERHYTRSFLSPVGKVETLRLSNVRSTTPSKYGQGVDPANPVKGGQRASFRNRRS